MGMEVNYIFAIYEGFVWLKIQKSLGNPYHSDRLILLVGAAEG